MTHGRKSYGDIELMSLVIQNKHELNHTQDCQVKMLVVHYQLLCIPITSLMMRMLPGHRVTGFFLSTSSVFAARREEPEDVVQQRLHEANYKETSVSFDSCFVFWWKKPLTVLQLLHPKKMSVNEWVLTWLLAIDLDPPKNHELCKSFSGPLAKSAAWCLEAPVRRSTVTPTRKGGDL